MNCFLKDDRQNHQCRSVDLPWNDLPLTISRDTHHPIQFRNQLTPNSPYSSIPSSGRSLRWLLVRLLTRRPHPRICIVRPTQARAPPSNFYCGGEKCFYTFDTPPPCRVLTFHPALESPCSSQTNRTHQDRPRK